MSQRGQADNAANALVGQVPCSMCAWCRWKERIASIRLADCHHPLAFYEAPRCYSRNKKADCRLYEPTRWTSLVQLVGLRRPPYRPVSSE